MKAWHWLAKDGHLQWPCGRIRKPRVGQTLRVDPDKLELCRYGLHASVRILDALGHAPGPIICRVELGGRILRAADKVVASERTIISMADATETLHLMACWSARRALRLVDNPDPRSIAAIEAKERWLRGEINDTQLYVARAAACDVARDAAWAAAWAARDAAWDAAWDARDAARVAARDAANAAQNRKLTEMVNRLLKEAA